MAAPFRPWSPASESTWMPLFNLSGAFCSLCLALIVFCFVRPPKSANRVRVTMLSDTVYELCHDDNTVSSELLKDPSQSGPKVFEHLYHDRKSKAHSRDSKESVDDTNNELKKVLECGNWGNSEPSELFLKVS